MEWERISVGVCRISCLILSTPTYIRQPLGSLVSGGMVRIHKGRGQKVALCQPERQGCAIIITMDSKVIMIAEAAMVFLRTS